TSQAGQRGSVVLISMVVETVVAAPCGPSATSSTWITIEPFPLCTGGGQSKPGARRPLQRTPAVGRQNPCKPARPCASARRSPSPFGLVRCRPQHGGWGGGRWVEPQHCHSRPISAKPPRSAISATPSASSLLVPFPTCATG